MTIARSSFALPFLACVIAAPSALPAAETPKSVSATLKDKDGRTAGKVVLSWVGDHLMGTVEAAGLSEGRHGMHIHAVGTCTAPDFASAGGHLNPDNKQHGLNNGAGPHQGDLPQLVVGSDGKGAQAFNTHTTIGAILDQDGSAFVVHAGEDDQKTDPSGNSGARVLCGVFEPVD